MAWWIIPVLATALASFVMADNKAELQVVPQVDLARYAGEWYEVARTPNRFEKQCAGDVKVSYTLRPDGKIGVVNTCRKKDGKQDVAKGTAKVASEKGPNSKLKVTFFWPFSGNYWILALDPEYRWALVGEPDRKYLWLLSRTPSLAEASYREILQKAAAQGYDVSRVIRTEQTAK